MGGCEKPEQKAVRALEEKNLAFNADDFVASAARGDQEAIVHYLTAGMDVDATNGQGLTALLQATERGHLEIVKLLLGAGANPDIASPDGWSPLLAAAEHDHAEIAKVLLEAHADVTTTDANGWTALMKAVYQGNTATVKQLAPYSTEEADRALMLAALKNHHQIVPVLVENGADVNATTEEKQTPLMFAAMKGNEKAANALLEAGADPSITDGTGLTADVLALQRGFGELSAQIAKSDTAQPDDDYRPVTPEALPSPTPTPAPQTGSEETAEATPAPNDQSNGSSDTASTNPDIAAVDNPEASIAVEEIPTVPSEETPLPDEPVTADNPVASIYPESQATSPSSTSDLVSDDLSLQGVVYREYREEPVPFILVGVNGSTAQLAMTDGSNAQVQVRRGDRVPNTSYRIESVSAKSVSSKEGQQDDVSEATLFHTPSGQSFKIIKDIQAFSPTTSAQLEETSTSSTITIHHGDEVTIPQHGKFRVLDLSRDQVMLEAVGSGEIYVVPKSN